MKSLTLNIEKVEKLRLAHKYTKTDLARKMGVLNSSITYMYHARPVKMASKVASVFGMDVTYFITEE